MRKKAPNLDNLALKVEKIEAKLEAFNSLNTETNSRISELSEEIGELRSMIINTERVADKSQSDIEEMREIVKEIEPKKTYTTLQKFKEKINMLEAYIEKNGDNIKVIQEKIENIDKKLRKLGDIDTLTDMYKNLNSKLKEIEEKKRRIEKIESKTEAIFSELSKELTKLDDFFDRVAAVEELSAELTKDLDKVKIKVSNMEKRIGSDTFKSIYEKIDLVKKALQQNDKMSEDIKKLYERTDKIENLSKKIVENSDLPLKYIKELEERISEIERDTQEISKLKEETNALTNKVKEILTFKDNLIKEWYNKLTYLEEANHQAYSVLESRINTLERSLDKTLLLIKNVINMIKEQ